MFRQDLERRLKGIFGVKAVKFDAPSESREQDTLFVSIDEAIPRVGSGLEACRVTGEIAIYSQREKVPFGFFAKRVEQADPSLVRPIFFSGFDSNSEIYQNLVERRLAFTFLYQAQYDPNQGEMTGMQFGDAS